MHLRHTPIVEHLTTAHSYREMHLPVVTRVTLARAARPPPSAMTVWAFPNRDLQISPTDTPCAAASMAHATRRACANDN